MENNWIRYRFYTYNVTDYRPLVFNPNYPWWCSGYGQIDDGEPNAPEYVVIIAYLPSGEDLYKYWDDAFNVEGEEKEKIEFSDRFPKPEYFEEQN